MGGGGGGETKTHHLSFHLPHLHLHGGGHWKKDIVKDIPKGCLAVMVGHEGEEQQRFVIPVIYINHPLFMQLLKEAEKEYGFDHKGPITIPCQVEEFRSVQDMIHCQNYYCSHYHHHHHHSSCFKA